MPAVKIAQGKNTELVLFDKSLNSLLKVSTYFKIPKKVFKKVRAKIIDYRAVKKRLRKTPNVGTVRSSI